MTVFITASGSYGNLTVNDVTGLLERIRVVEEGIKDAQQAVENWNFAGSIFFAMTVVTTIGKPIRVIGITTVHSSVLKDRSRIGLHWMCRWATILDRLVL